MRMRAHSNSGLAAATVNPSFLAFSPDRRHLYAVNEVDEYHGEKSGSVSSFAVERGSDKLQGDQHCLLRWAAARAKSPSTLHGEGRLCRQL